ncbi:MAG: FIG00819990: hypothetical protein, partial [uncultured Nocardioides sp.]
GVVPRIGRPGARLGRGRRRRPAGPDRGHRRRRPGRRGLRQRRGRGPAVVARRGRRPRRRARRLPHRPRVRRRHLAAHAEGGSVRCGRRRGRDRGGPGRRSGGHDDRGGEPGLDGHPARCPQGPEGHPAL